MAKKLLFILILLISLVSFSQPLSGTYTVGGTAPDYDTIVLAVAALEANGISGPVTLNIRSGTYSLQPLTLTAISGSSSVNTITFKSETNNNADVIFIDSPFLLSQGVSDILVKFITFSGWKNKIEIATPGMPTSNIIISDCVFTNTQALVSATYMNNVNYAGQTTQIKITAGSAISIHNNIFNNVGAAVRRNGAPGTVSITNNTVNGGIFPIQVSQTNGLIITGNVYTGDIKLCCLSASTLFGNSVISRNKFISTNTEVGGSAISGNYDGIGTLTFANNFVSMGNPLEIKAFYDANIYYNSFYSDDSHSLRITHSSLLNTYNIYGNIFKNPLDKPSILAHMPAALPSLNSNYNAFSNNMKTYHRYYTGEPGPGTIYTLPEWTAVTAEDLNSKIVGDVFTIPTDLHVGNEIMLNNAGIPIASVTVDIDGEPRSLTSPDIGADEFDMNFATFNDLSLAVVSPISACDTAPIVVSVTNHSTFPVNGFDLECVINHNFGYTTHYDNVINPSQSIPITLTQCGITGNTWYENYEVFVKNPNGQLDNNFENDRALYADLFQFGSFEILSETTDCSTIHHLSVPNMYGATQLWSTGQAGTAIDATAPGAYTVTVTDIGGCSVTKTININ